MLPAKRPQMARLRLERNSEGSGSRTLRLRYVPRSLKVRHVIHPRLRVLTDLNPACRHSRPAHCFYLVHEHPPRNSSSNVIALLHITWKPGRRCPAGPTAEALPKEYNLRPSNEANTNMHSFSEEPGHMSESLNSPPLTWISAEVCSHQRPWHSDIESFVQV